jgi:hypothetical protein
MLALKLTAAHIMLALRLHQNCQRQLISTLKFPIKFPVPLSIRPLPRRSTQPLAVQHHLAPISMPVQVLEVKGAKIRTITGKVMIRTKVKEIVKVTDKVQVKARKEEKMTGKTEMTKEVKTKMKLNRVTPVMTEAKVKRGVKVEMKT